jgi:hypothetical protein
MTKRHLCPVEVEKVHQLDRFAFAQRGEIHSFGLVIQLELDREDFDVFCISAQRISLTEKQHKTHGKMARRPICFSRRRDSYQLARILAP